jgi:hypothetical protein
MSIGESKTGFEKSAEFAEIRRIQWWPFFQKLALFKQKSVLF